MNNPILESILTCPRCGHAKLETMPTDACQFFYECENCKTLLSPKVGDCCVYCSYGSVKCPPIQEQHGCCSLGATSRSDLRHDYKDVHKRAHQEGRLRL